MIPPGGIHGSPIDARYVRVHTPEEHRAETASSHMEHIATGRENARTSTILCAFLMVVLAIVCWANASGHASIIAWAAFVIIAIIACGFATHAWSNWYDVRTHERQWRELQQRLPKP